MAKVEWHVSVLLRTCCSLGRPLGVTLEGAEVFLTIETARPSAVHSALNAIPIGV